MARTGGKMAGDSPSQHLGTEKGGDGQSPTAFCFGGFFLCLLPTLLIPRARSQGAHRLEGETRFTLDTVVKGMAT